MSLIDETSLNAFFYVIVPLMLVAILYMIAQLPQTVRDGVHRIAVIGLLIAIILVQYRTWKEITAIRSDEKHSDTRH